MSKVRDFFLNLKKSTRITLISCLSFILLTFIILCFFILSPITPTDKAGNTYGRESISRQDGNTSSQITTSLNSGETVVSNVSADYTTTVTTTQTTTRTEYVITITTGTGLYTDGLIPTGKYDNYYNQNPYNPAGNGNTTGGDEPASQPGNEPATTDTGLGGETSSEPVSQVSEFGIEPTEAPAESGGDTPSVPDTPNVPDVPPAEGGGDTPDKPAE
jgi:hypothetical protein